MKSDEPASRRREATSAQQAPYLRGFHANAGRSALKPRKPAWTLTLRDIRCIIRVSKNGPGGPHPNPDKENLK